MTIKKLLLTFSIFLLSLIGIVGQPPITPQTALQNYLNIEDATFAWEIRDSYPVDNVTAYSILLTSQKWQGILWKHELIIFAPKVIDYDGALLFITGSSIKDNEPKISNQNERESQQMASLAENNRAVVGLLRQVPNQPLYDDLYEDALISYTLNEFRKDNDYTWPLLFPMVKSASKAMDAIQEFASETLSHKLNRFVVSGFSKRGWTTWLTGAIEDERVVAIAPVVIDMLNMPATLNYQKEVYGQFSKEIDDYVKLEIPQAVNSPFGKAVVEMIDPYSYRHKLTIPKMIFFGTNDPYWTIDAVKHYIDDIPGNNLLHYVANAGHGLGDKKQALSALSAFFALNLANKPLPVYSWALKERWNRIHLTVKATPNQLVRGVFWTSTSNSRDFREAKWESDNIELNKRDKSKLHVKLKYPKSGFRAFYVDLIYMDDKGKEYSVSTQAYVADKNEVFINK
ncbi:MAG: PhoPQ-activated protein PqaA family protein [Dysgonamonadaceae bacterium]|nr:PhoPQ-activated protein PqaA family protein [Dysgonamonadaceae bacterium]MDD4729062.1 PhoPQ-activated protein PqaA family protein [Dysgonamonadaceae bacterium]